MTAQSKKRAKDIWNLGFAVLKSETLFAKKNLKAAARAILTLHPVQNENRIADSDGAVLFLPLQSWALCRRLFTLFFGSFSGRLPGG
jgi:hypothetical protein